MPKGVTADSVAVMDRALMAELIAEAANERFEGSLHRAVADTNVRAAKRRMEPVSYRTVRRLRNREEPRIRGATLNWLMLLVRRPNRDRLLATVALPDVQVALDAHEAEVNAAIQRVLGQRGAEKGGLLAVALDRIHHQQVARRGFKHGVAPLPLPGDGLLVHAEVLLEDMRGRIALRRAFHDFDEAGRGHSSSRVRLAELELVRPFLSVGAFSGIERRWEELSEPEAKDYVESVLRAQQVLLSRAPDLQRAQVVAARGKGKRAER